MGISTDIFWARALCSQLLPRSSLLQFLRTKYPRLSQSVEEGMKEGLQNFQGLRAGLRKDVVEDAPRRRRRRRAKDPLGTQGFSDDDALDFGLDVNTRVFGRQERHGRMHTLPGQRAPVTSRLPSSQVQLRDNIAITNATDVVIVVRAWVLLSDNERWRGVRLPRADDSALLGAYTAEILPGEVFVWNEAPQGWISFHEVSGRPATLELSREPAGWALHPSDAPAPSGAVVVH